MSVLPLFIILIILHLAFTQRSEPWNASKYLWISKRAHYRYILFCSHLSMRLFSSQCFNKTVIRTKLVIQQISVTKQRWAVSNRFPLHIRGRGEFHFTIDSILTQCWNDGNAICVTLGSISIKYVQSYRNYRKVTTVDILKIVQMIQISS